MKSKPRIVAGRAAVAGAIPWETRFAIAKKAVADARRAIDMLAMHPATKPDTTDQFLCYAGNTLEGSLSLLRDAERIQKSPRFGRGNGTPF